tara:strand:+ start:3997 stop:5697 length:1701 start_codon:yes stop_codon:yes gene_type:complete
MRRVNRPPTKISKSAAGSISDVRRAQITSAVNKQMDLAEQANIHGSVVHSPNFRANGSGMLKTASIASPMPGPTMSSSTDRLSPEIYSPLFQLANLNLPRDRVTMNAWNRVFYDTHPLVRNAINLHASYPISKINISCKNKQVQQFFMEMAERIDLYSIVYGAALEFWKMGEAFPYAELDETQGSWSRITILNPDYVHVKKSVIGNQVLVSLRPDANLQRIINSQSPSDLSLKKHIPRHIVDYVRKGQNIPLDAFNISHLKLLSSPYDVRGTSVIVSTYKDLMLYDKFRECKFAQADGMVNPLTLVTLGGEGDYRATQADIEAFKNLMEEAQYDKDFKIVTHNGVKIERAGFSGGTLDIGSDIDHIVTNLYAGLMVPKALMDQESATYASSSVGLEVLRQRYDIFRNMIKKWLERKVFAPICELQDFFEYKDGEKRLLIPSIDFNHMNLYDMADYIQNVSQFVGNKQVSLQTLHRSLGLSYEEERRRIREEMIDEQIFAKEQQVLGNMRLSELLTLDPNKTIPEPPEGAPDGGAPPDLPGVPSGGGGPPPPGGPMGGPPGGGPPGA